MDRRGSDDERAIKTVALFSYGTLQLPAVQQATYGRLLEGEADVLPGHRLLQLKISDPKVVQLSGKAVHTIAVSSGDPEDRIPGLLFRLTAAELEATDAYEIDAYARVEALLESGQTAWVYIGSANA